VVAAGDGVGVGVGVGVGAFVSDGEAVTTIAGGAGEGLLPDVADTPISSPTNASAATALSTRWAPIHTTKGRHQGRRRGGGWFGFHPGGGCHGGGG
jgi:hypothetical protein